MKPARVPAAERALLPEGRLAGPMPYVVAIMTFLTVLAVAAGWALGSAAAGLGRDLSAKLTVQIVEANPDRREAQARTALGQLVRLSAVARAERVDERRMRALLEPWLGREGLQGDLPIPVLIDVDLAEGNDRAVEGVAAAVRAVAPSARVERHARFLAPVTGLLETLRWLALALVLLMAAATAASVVLAVRAGLVAHRATIDVMHLMGATDAQVARLFQRRAAMDALFGSATGFALGALAVFVVGTQLLAIDAAIVRSGGLGWGGWVAVALVPLGAIGLAVIVARLTVLRALKASL